MQGPPWYFPWLGDVVITTCGGPVFAAHLPGAVIYTAARNDENMHLPLDIVNAILTAADLPIDTRRALGLAPRKINILLYVYLEHILNKTAQTDPGPFQTNLSNDNNKNGDVKRISLNDGNDTIVTTKDNGYCIKSIVTLNVQMGLTGLFHSASIASMH